MVIYLETSIFVAYLLKEPGSQKFITLINQAENIVTSILTFIEARRTLRRLESEKMLLPLDIQRVLGIIAQLALKWNLMDLTPEVQKRAGELFPSEPIRTLDAIHLATALEFLNVFPGLAVLSRDKRILENLEPLGLVKI